MILDPEEAQLLVQALTEQSALLGESGGKLLKLLVDTGIRPPEASGHVRTEYMPPLK